VLTACHWHICLFKFGADLVGWIALYELIFVVHTEKQFFLKKIRDFSEPGQWHLGKKFFQSPANILPRVPRKSTRGKDFVKKTKLFPECNTQGRGF
jgi:hypothetical protein